MPDIISPIARNAPRFKASEPDELDRFFRNMEREFVKAGITDAKEMIEKLGEYAEATTEKLWKTLPAYQAKDGANPSFNNYKDEIKTLYPTTYLADRGSTQGLERICRDYQGIREIDLDRYAAFKREFTLEAYRLLKAGTQIVTNRDLVVRFIGTFSDRTGQELTTCLRARHPRPVGRHVEDPWTLETVISEADELMNSGGTRVGFGSPSSRLYEADKTAPVILNRPTVITPRVKDEMELMMEQMAALQTHIVTAEKHRAQEIEEALKRALAQRQQPVSNQYHAASTGNRGYNPNLNEINCYYCDEPGHMQNNCDHKANHLKDGITTRSADGRITMSDGSRLPNAKPGESHILKERIEARHKTLLKQQMMNELWMEADEPSVPMYQGQFKQTVYNSPQGWMQPPAQPSWQQQAPGYGNSMQTPQMYAQANYQPQYASAGPRSQYTAAVQNMPQTQMTQTNNDGDRIARLEALLTQVQSQLVATRGGAETNPITENGPNF
jgi:hypothetical protein